MTAKLTERKPYTRTPIACPHADRRKVAREACDQCYREAVKQETRR